MKKRGLYSKVKLSKTLSDILGEDDFTISDDEAVGADLRFHIANGVKSNLFLTQIEWSKVIASPCAFLNEDILEWDLPALIIKRFFHGEGAINPEEGFAGVVKKNATLKMTNDFSIGHISDQIAEFARENRMNPVSVRGYLVSVLSFLEYLRSSGHCDLPVDFDFGKSNDSFYIQINCPVSNIYIENFLEATKENSIRNPFVSLLEESVTKTDLLEIYTLSSTKKLVISACWVSNPNYIRREEFPSLLLHQIESFKQKEFSANQARSITSILEPSLEKSNKRISLMEKMPSRFEELSTLKSKKNPILIKRLVNYVFDRHGEGFDFEEYDVLDLLDDMVGFYDQEALASISDEEKEEVIRLINNGEAYQELVGQAKIIKENIEQEDYFESLISSIDTMSLDTAQTISGSKHEREASQLVKGSSEEEDVEVVISGMTEVLNEESWKVKRSGAAEKVRGKFNDLRKAGLSNQEIDLEVKNIIIAELGVSELAGANIIEALGDDVADDFIRNGLVKNNEEIKHDILISKMEKKLEVRGQQVEKMKSLIEHLNNELRSKKVIIGEDNLESFNILNREFEEHDSLKQEESYEKAKDIEYIREIEKVTNEKNKLLKENDILLRKFKETLVEDSSDSKDADTLESENENLKSQIEALKKRIGFMYENSKANKEVSVSAAEVQKIIDDKERYFSEKMKLKTELEDQKLDFRSLEAKVKVLESDQDKSQSISKKEASSIEKAELLAKEREFEDLRIKMSKLQAESRAHELKAKSFEQKVKFLNAQLEKYQKEDSRKKAKRGALSSVDSKLSGRLKQIEAVSMKLKSTNDKLAKELAEKKTEAHKASLESKTMALKIKDLERKLALVSKNKAA